MDKIVRVHRIISYLHSKKIPVLPGLLNKVIIRTLFSCQLGITTKIGANCSFGYGGLGVVVHHRAVLGDNVEIGSCVTIGGSGGSYEVPVIGDNTMISTGAKILGPITIGKNCVIGANAVVLQNIPDNSVAVGVPARIVKTNINIADYR